MSKERPIGFTILSIEKEILVKLEYKKLISNFEFQKARCQKHKTTTSQSDQKGLCEREEKREGFAQGRDNDEGW